MEAYSSGSAREESSFTADERVSSLFQPDTLLSTQYFENLRRKTLFEPEKRLMLAILEDGIHCYFDNLHASGGKKSVCSKTPRLGSSRATTIGCFHSRAFAMRLA